MDTQMCSQKTADAMLSKRRPHFQEHLILESGGTVNGLSMNLSHSMYKAELGKAVIGQ